MKYIRTENGVHKIFDTHNGYKNHWGYKYKENCVILLDSETMKSEKAANTIEELCDLYVMVHLDCEKTPDIFMQKIPLQRGYKINKDYIIYGAIWTDKGLIYVAKMNEKGELELL